MMLIELQIIGLLFVFVMIYLTYLNYKRKNYGSRSFSSWLFVWIIAGLVVVFPNFIYGFMNYLSIERTHDFFYIGAFVVLFVIVFNMYITMKKTYVKVERLVRENAIKNPVKKKKP